MSIGDNNFDEDEKRDGEQHPGSPSQPDKAPESAKLPASESDEVPGISVHLTDEKKGCGLGFSVLNLAKRASALPANWYNKIPQGRRPSNRVVLIGLASIVGIGLIVPGIWLGYNSLPSIDMLEDYKPVEAVKVYDIHNRLAAVVSGDEDRLTVKLNAVSAAMKKAMLAAEDHEFYDHDGFSVASMARAALKNLQAGRVVEGASTITQQLVKNLFFPGEDRTINRKIKEIVLATQVDAKYSKEQILEMYLNQIYFGNKSYGIERAAQRYFNKPASRLSLAESSFLAGVVKAPSALSNPANRSDAIKRQHVVLDKMVEYKLASPAEAEKAKQGKLAFRKFVNPYQKYPFYIAHVVDELRARYSTEELQRGMNVYTNLDPDAQLAGEKALTHGIDKAPRGVEQGALVSVRIDDGAVLALVGGVGQYEKNQWNRAVSPHTMGSSFKPFVYLAGFLKGQSPDDIVVDAPVSFPSGGRSWTPRNFEGGFMGAMTIRKALAQSRNVCAAKVAYKVGINNVINTAHRSGLTSKIEPYLPVSLGAAAASPIDMAGAYSTFARGGVHLKPQIFRRIEDNNGKVLATFALQPRKVFDSHATAKLVDIMQAVVTSGTGIRAQLKNRPVAGKTGTSDAAKDIWFVGFTPDTACAVWGGNDHNKAIHNRGVTGGMIMATIFKKYMEGYYAKHPTPVLAFLTPGRQESKIASDDSKLSPKAKKAATDSKVADKMASSDTKPSTGQSNGRTTNTTARRSRLARNNVEQDALVERQQERAAVVGDDATRTTPAPGGETNAAAANSPREGNSSVPTESLKDPLMATPKPLELQKDSAAAPVIHRIKASTMPSGSTPERSAVPSPTAAQAKATPAALAPGDTNPVSGNPAAAPARALNQSTFGLPNNRF